MRKLQDLDRTTGSKSSVSVVRILFVFAFSVARFAICAMSTEDSKTESFHEKSSCAVTSVGPSGDVQVSKSERKITSKTWKCRDRPGINFFYDDSGMKQLCYRV